MVSPVDDLSMEGFLRVLREAGTDPRAKAEALEGLALRKVWLATWEPHAEGFRTLINSDGEEALAIFSSESELMLAADRFEWLETDGTVANHQSLGEDILRHAWTREYAFVVLDIAASHSLEFDREELRSALREMETTGPFRTSRPPSSSVFEEPEPASSFPPPVERISTTYSMAPTSAEEFAHLTEAPARPGHFYEESEPPTKPHPKPAGSQQPGKPESRRAHPRARARQKSEQPTIEEVVPESAAMGAAGTYGAASVFPPTERTAAGTERPGLFDPPATPSPEAAAPFNSEAPTAPTERPSDLVTPRRLVVPPLEPPAPEQQPTGAAAELQAELQAKAFDTGPRLDFEEESDPDEAVSRQPPAGGQEAKLPSRLVPPSIGDAIELVELRQAPDEGLLETLAVVLRRYPEIEWAAYCHVARASGEEGPGIGLRIVETYRDNVTTIIKELCESGGTRDIELEVLLIDGHDLLRKAREHAFVFFPWKPKPFGR